MVQTYQSPVRVYKYPFELVMAAYHKRFPTCPQIPIFVGSDITYEWKAEDGGEEIVERKCQLNVDAPYLVKKIAGVDYVYFKQRNHLDLRKRILLIEASNISFSNRIVVIENCRYYVHTENPEWTCFEQSASLDVKSFFGFETAVEKLAVKQYGANIAKGKEVLEFFIEELIKSGINQVPIWKPVPGVTEEKYGDTKTTIQTADGLIGGVELATKMNGKLGDGTMAISNDEIEKEIPIPDRMSPPSTPPASSSGFGSSTTTNVTLANELISAPLYGTAEEKLSMEELKRRRSSAAGVGKQTGAGTSAGTQQAAGVGIANTGRDQSGQTKSFDDLESKLESEYIQRFLGQLTPLEESRLCELKYGIQSAHKGKIPNDAHLLRFLRARDFDVQKANKMVMNSLLWRKQHNVDKILHDFVAPAVLLKYFPGGWHHNDKNGRPMFILRLGQMDIKGLLRSVGLEAIVKLTLSICEQGLLKTAEATNRLGKPISAWTLLVDLEGLSMRHLWRPGVQCLLRIIETLEAHYPECLGMVLITRAPRAFPILWTLVSPFIDENTRKKFELYASDQVLHELARYVPEEFLLDFLGGPCHFETEASKDGPPWMVPKSEYSVQGDELLRRENAEDILTSIYTSATINRGSPYEICVWVPQIGSVLTWDFDILKGECEFLLYHTEKKIMPKTAQQYGPPTSSTVGGPSSSSTSASPPGPLDRVMDTVTSEISNLLSSTSPSSIPHYHAIAVDPELRVGNELTIVERPLAFAESDSMQGSNYCAKPGTYILQFRHPSDSANLVADSQAAAQKKDSLVAGDGGGGTAKSGTTHKCRLMVYHELLNSADFRGSVASLESCRSSFNSLAAAAGADSSLHSSKQNSPSNKRRIRIAQQQQKAEEEEEEDDSEEQTPQAEDLSKEKTKS